MTPQAPAAIRATLQALIVGELHNAGSTTPSNVVRDATATALDAVWPQIAGHFAQGIADLKRDSAGLRALEAAGVDNWDGYSDALSDLD